MILIMRTKTTSGILRKKQNYTDFQNEFGVDEKRILSFISNIVAKFKTKIKKKKNFSNYNGSV